MTWQNSATIRFGETDKEHDHDRQAAEKARELAAQHPEARVVIFPLRGSWFAVRA